MRFYLISYDLRAPGRNYESLYKALRNVDFCHPLGSVWIIGIEDTAMAVRNALRTHLDSNDGLIVFEIKTEADWAIWGINTPSVDWIKQHLP